MHQFDEHHAEFKGFSAFYDSEIFPNLEQGENARLTAIGKAKKIVPLVILAFLIGLGVAWHFKVPPPVYFIISGFGVAASFITPQLLLKDVKSATKGNIVGGICKFLGWSFSEAVEIPPYFDRFQDLGLLTTGYNRSNFEDRVSGEAHGAKFEFYEAHLEKKKSSNNKTTWVTVFRGQLLALDFDQKFLGRTVVLRDHGWLQGKKKGDMKRVGLVDPVFEKIFEAYGTDQVEARYLLTPTFMQRLVDLETSVDGHQIRFGFVHGQLLIAVETANRYEVGSMFKPLIDTGRTQKILDDFGAIYGVIDGVMKR